MEQALDKEAITALLAEQKVKYDNWSFEHKRAQQELNKLRAKSRTKKRQQQIEAVERAVISAKSFMDQAWNRALAIKAGEYF